MNWVFLLSVPLLTAAPQAAEVSYGATPDPLAAPETAIVVAPLDVEDGWLELTHLGSEAPSVFIDLGDRLTEDGTLTLYPDLPPGPTMLCTAGRPYAVTCEEVYRGADEYLGLETIDAIFSTGLEIRGVYIQDLDPVAGARVAVVPAGLDAFRAYTLPLASRGRRIVREVATNEAGRFRLPEIAPGEYFLETLLPSGRVHRTDPFEVPDRNTLRRHYEVNERVEGKVFWDLEIIVVPSGLDVELVVVDWVGDPIPDAAVTASQGRTPQEAINFEGTSGTDGRVILHGLNIELPVRLTCDKDGFRPFEQEYELLPVEVDCVLRPWARVRGEVIGPDSLPPRGATVAVRPAGQEIEPSTAAVTYDGSFLLGELAQGDYELRVAAPGYRVEERVFSVDFGQDLDLGPILLLFAREVQGTVVDAKTGEPIAGVDIRSVSPPGAVDTFSDVDGEFTFGFDSSEPLRLEFSTFDYAAREIVFKPDELDAREPLVVELVEAGWILAEVMDGEERCQGCRVVLWPGGEEMWTDATGEAFSGPLAAGVYRVARPRVTHLGSTVVEQADAEMHRVRVQPGRLSVVHLGSEGRTVRVRFRGGLDGLWMLSARSGRRTEKNFPESDGTFAVRQRPGESLDLFLHTYDEEMGAELTVWQAILPGGFQSDSFSFELSGSQVRGRVVGSEGPLAGAQVRLVGFAEAPLRAVTYSYPDGSFHVPHVRPGVYALYVGPRNVKFLSVGARQTVDLGTFELFLDE